MIEEFIDNFKSNSTRKTYRSHLTAFFKFLNLNPDNYFSTEQDYERDVISFAKSLWNRPPGSQQVILSTVRLFLSEYDVEIRKKIWRNIKNRRGGSKTISIEYVPNNSEIKQILQYGGIKARALYTLLSSSGMRLDEALQLKMNDIDLEKRWIHMPYNITKSRRNRETGFTQEARDALVEWLKYRPKFLINGYRKSKFLRDKYEKEGISTTKIGDRWVFIKDGMELKDYQLETRIFPFGTSSARKMWNNILENAGPPFNEKDEQDCLCFPRYKYHIHTLRKFWFTEMLNNGANESHVNVMGGHDSNLDNRYIKPRTSVLKQTYDEHCGCLEIFSERWRIQKEIKPKLKDQGITITSLLTRNRDLEIEMGEIKGTIELLHGAMKNILSKQDYEQTNIENEEQDKLIKKQVIEKLARTYTDKQINEDKELMKNISEIIKELKTEMNQNNQIPMAETTKSPINNIVGY